MSYIHQGLQQSVRRNGHPVSKTLKLEKPQVSASMAPLVYCPVQPFHKSQGRDPTQPSPCLRACEEEQKRMLQRPKVSKFPKELSIHLKDAFTSERKVKK